MLLDKALSYMIHVVSSPIVSWRRLRGRHPPERVRDGLIVRRGVELKEYLERAGEYGAARSQRVEDSKIPAGKVVERDPVPCDSDPTVPPGFRGAQNNSSCTSK